MKMPTLFLIVGLAFALSGSAAESVKPGKFKVAEAGRSVSFLAVGSPSLLRIRGESKNLTGAALLQAGAAPGAMQMSGDFQLDLASLETGIKKRDQHMTEKYLETGKFPKAALTLQSQDFKDGAGVPFKGTLEMHGVTKPVEGLADIKTDGEAVLVKAAFKLKITDFGIGIPSFAGITVADTVDVETAFKAEKTQ